MPFVVLAVPKPIVHGKFVLLQSPAEFYFYQYESPFQEWIIPRYNPVKNHRTYTGSKRYVKYTTKWPEYHLDYDQPKKYSFYDQHGFILSHDNQLTVAKQPKNQWLRTTTKAKFQFIQALFDAVEKEIAKSIVQGLSELIQRFQSVSPR